MPAHTQPTIHSSPNGRSRAARSNQRSRAHEAARAAFLKRFEDQVDPDGKFPPDERRRRAQHALKSHMTSLAIKCRSPRFIE